MSVDNAAFDAAQHESITVSYNSTECSSNVDSELSTIGITYKTTHKCTICSSHRTTVNNTECCAKHATVDTTQCATIIETKHPTFQYTIYSTFFSAI